MGDRGTADPTCQAQPTRRAPAEGPHAGSPAYAVLPEPQWLPMGYVAARSAAQEDRLGLFCAMARRWDMGQDGQGVARADAWGCWACTHAQCRVHRQSIGQDYQDGGP